MENTVINNTVLDKKLDGYGIDSKLQNFVASQEITVTITLAEYRDLVSRCATAKSDIDKAESDRYERNKKIEALEKEVCELKSKIYSLQNPEEDEI